MVNRVDLGNINSLDKLHPRKNQEIPEEGEVKFSRLMEQAKKTESTDTTNKSRVEVNQGAGAADETSKLTQFQIRNTVEELLRYQEIVEKSMDTERLAKLEKVKRSIEDGTYNVSPEKVAAKILKSGFFS